MKVVLQSHETIRVVAEAKDGIEAVAEAERHRPNVAILDRGLPNCDGIKATAMIKERLPECRVVLMTGEDDENALIEALDAGASGYITKECPLSDLVDATLKVSRGETLIPGRMLGSVLSTLIKRRRSYDGAVKRLAELTRREKEVLALLANGADNNAIAQNLVISPQTARTHIQNIFTKLDVHSRLEAVTFVVNNGLQPDLVGA